MLLMEASEPCLIGCIYMSSFVGAFGQGGGVGMAGTCVVYRESRR